MDDSGIRKLLKISCLSLDNSVSTAVGINEHSSIISFGNETKEGITNEPIDENNLESVYKS